MQMILNSLIIGGILWIFRKYLSSKELTKEREHTLEERKERRELLEKPYIFTPKSNLRRSQVTQSTPILRDELNHTQPVKLEITQSTSAIKQHAETN